MDLFPVKILMFLLQALKKFQTTDCKKYLAEHDTFSTKVMALGSKANLIPALDNYPALPALRKVSLCHPNATLCHLLDAFP